MTYQKPPGDLLPSLERHSVEELIQELLKAHDSRRFDAVQWLRESFAGTRRHDKATVEAMRAAFVDFVSRLDPRDLATRFERSARRKTMGNWELYGEFYRSPCEMQPDSLPHIFVETFAQNYSRRRATTTTTATRRRLTVDSAPPPAACEKSQARSKLPIAIRLGSENRPVAGDSKGSRP